MKIAYLKWQRFWAISHLLYRAWQLHRAHQRDQMYNLIGDELFKLGGVYIKFLQGVILQSWLMQRWRSERKLDVFEKIDATDLDVVAILQENLGNQVDRLSELETTPFAVGSFGHIYKATLDQQQPVIVKVLSPRISQTLKFDLRLLKFFWRLHLRSIKLNQGLNVKLILKDFAQQTLQEIDYLNEAQFANEQYLTYKDHPQLVIPKTHLELCTKEIIIQNYVDGLAITNLLRLKEAQPDFNARAYVKKQLKSDLIAQLQVLAYEIFWATFDQPKVMGDPHPGNVILLPNDQIALIDFGVIAHSTPNATAYFKLLKAYHALFQDDVDLEEIFLSNFQFFGRDLYLALTKLNHLLPQSQSRTDLNRELAKAVKEAFDDMYPEQDMKTLFRNPKALIIFHRLANQHNRFGFKFQIDDVEMIRTLITLTSLIDALDAYVDVMKPVYEKVIKQVETVYSDIQTITDPDISHSQALHIIFTWLERIATRDPGLFYSLMHKLHLRTDAPVSENKVLK